jgi:hypothetical protein
MELVYITQGGGMSVVRETLTAMLDRLWYGSLVVSHHLLAMEWAEC